MEKLLSLAGMLILLTACGDKPGGQSYTYTADQKSPHTIVVTLEAKPGQEKALEDLLLSVVNPSRAEATNLDYRLHRDVNNPARFVLYENWTSKKDHEKQFNKPYIAELITKVDGMLAKPYEVTVAKEL